MAVFGHQHAKTTGRKLGTATPRRPEGVRQRGKEWHELLLRAISEFREPKAGAEKVKIHDF